MKQLHQNLIRDHGPPNVTKKTKIVNLQNLNIMKTIQIIFLLLIFSITVNSQITKGNWMVGGSGNLSSYKAESYSISTDNKSVLTGKSVYLSPTIGYFVIDKLALGLSPSYGYFETVNTSGNNYNIGAFARYYLLNQDKSINIFTQASYSQTIGNDFVKGHYYIIKAGPSFFFNDNVAFECTLDYITDNTKFPSGNSGRGSSLNLGLGLQIHLKKY
jgi:hypothetical protein